METEQEMEAFILINDRNVALLLEQHNLKIQSHYLNASVQCIGHHRKLPLHHT